MQESWHRVKSLWNENFIEARDIRLRQKTDTTCDNTLTLLANVKPLD